MFATSAGSYRSQMPSAERKSGIPDSVDVAGPVFANDPLSSSATGLGETQWVGGAPRRAATHLRVAHCCEFWVAF
jgi:hypothetical protein